MAARTSCRANSARGCRLTRCRSVRLSDRLEARRRRRVPRVEHRRHRQLAFARLRDVGNQLRAGIARADLRLRPQRRRDGGCCHDDDRGVRRDRPEAGRKQFLSLCSRHDHRSGTEVLRRGRHDGPVRRVYADRRRGEWRRLQGCLEERRRQRVPRVGHRRRRQLAVANRRDVGNHLCDAIARDDLRPGPQR